MTPTLPPIDHPWAVFALAQADALKPPYGDFGQWDAVAFLLTGKPEYAVTAADRLLSVCSADPADANTVRECFFEWCLCFEWVKPALDADRDAKLRAALNRVCEFCFAINTPQYKGGWRYADSDQTTGQVFGLGVADKVLGTKWTERAEWVKGMEEVKRYITVLSAGGEWCESSLYNLGTLKILFTAAAMAGVDLGDFADQVCSQLLADLTPDFKDSVQWGDVQDARRSIVVERWAPLLSILYGITGRRDVYAAFERMTAGQTLKSWLSLGWRALYFYRPPPAPEPPKPLTIEERVAALEAWRATFTDPRPVPTVAVVEASPLRVSAGNGHVRYKRGDSLVAVHFPSRLNVDHEVTYPCDVQWWRNGEWVLTRPLGYGGTAVGPLAANSVVFAGLGAMQARGMNECRGTAVGFTALGSTGGDFLPANANYHKVPAFLKAHARGVSHTHPARLTVRDLFDGVHPNTLPQYIRYSAAVRALIEAAPALWQQVWHCPVKPDETDAGLEWTTAGGQVVKLTAPAGVRRLVLPESGTLPASQFKAAELVGYQVRFLSDEPSCEMVTTLEVG